MTTTTRTTTTSYSSLSLARKGFKKSASLPRRRSYKSPLEGVKVARSSSRRDDAQTTGKSNDDNQRRRVMFLGMTTATVSLLSAEKAKAFTVGGENLPSGSMFPSSNESFFNDEDEEEERYTTKDFGVGFCLTNSGVARGEYRVQRRNGREPEMAGLFVRSKCWCRCVWVFATDYSGLDAALH